MVALPSTASARVNGVGFANSREPLRRSAPHWARGRPTDEPWRRSGRVPEGVAEIHMDFMFMGEEKGDRTLAMLVVRERVTKAVMGCVAPRKSSGEWLGKRVLAFMRE